MKKKAIYLALATLFAACAQCSPITLTSTSCSTNQGTISDSAACTLAGNPNGSATASALAAYSISGSSLTVNLSDSANATGTFNSLGEIATGATASSSLSLNLIIGGSLRPGFVLATGTYVSFAGPGFTGSEAQYTLGPDPTGTPTTQLSCSAGGGTGNEGPLCVSYNVLQPLMLGTNIVFTGITEASANAGNGPAMGGAAAALAFTFQFFEADGVTPVDVALATPEPGTMALLAVSLIACISRTSFLSWRRSSARG